MKTGFILVWGSLILLLLVCIKCYGSAVSSFDTSNKQTSPSTQASPITEDTVKTEDTDNESTEKSDHITRLDFIESNGGVYIPAEQLYEYCKESSGVLPDMTYSEEYGCIVYGERYIPASVLVSNGELYISDSDAARIFGIKHVSGFPYEITYPRSDVEYYDSDELMWLSAIIHAEARGECFEGKPAVGTVVMNRVESQLYPDTVKDVIFDCRYGVQFSPTADGTIYLTPSDESVIAAKLCLEGYRTDSDILFFYNPEISESSFFRNERTFRFRIGNHEFYS